MLSPLENYYQKQEEPVKSCIQFLRSYILNYDAGIREEWKYGMPFFYYNGKMMCYMWFHKKHLQPYLGIVDGKHIIHADLIQEKRVRMKILLIDPNKDIPVKKLNVILKEMIALHKKKLVNQLY